MTLFTEEELQPSKESLIARNLELEATIAKLEKVARGYHKRILAQQEEISSLNFELSQGNLFTPGT